MKNLFEVPLFFIFFWLTFFRSEAQEKIKPSLSEIGESEEWTINNREVIKKDEGIYLKKNAWQWNCLE